MYKVKKTEEGYLGLFATDTIKKGTVILWLAKDSTYVPHPTRTSIQVRNLHLEHYEGGCTNHHCNPNAKILSIMWGLDMKAYYVPFNAFAENSTLNPILMASEDIFAGEEITFDYETTEEELAEPFRCNCHGRWIRGNNVTTKSPSEIMQEDLEPISDWENEGGMDYSGAFESDIK